MFLDVLLDHFRGHRVDLESAVAPVLGIRTCEEPMPFRVELSCDLNGRLIDAQHIGVEVEVLGRERDQLA